MRTLWRDEDSGWRTVLRGRQVLADPRINKGTAFGDSERRDLGLTGLIPAACFSLDDQVAHVYAQYGAYRAAFRWERSCQFRSQFGVQAFEKPSGRPDLNRRPLDPQVTIRASLGVAQERSVGS
jgi:hypothetical protein